MRLPRLVSSLPPGRSSRERLYPPKQIGICHLHLQTQPLSPLGPPSQQAASPINWPPTVRGRAIIWAIPPHLAAPRKSVPPLSRTPQLTLPPWPAVLWANVLFNAFLCQVPFVTQVLHLVLPVQKVLHNIMIPYSALSFTITAPQCTYCVRLTPDRSRIQE